MAITFGATCGAAALKTGTQNSFGITFNAAVAIGKAVVLIFATDNNATTTGDENAVTSVSDTKGNTWKKAVEFTNPSASPAAQAGSVCSIWYANITVALTTSDIVTLALSNGTIRGACTGTMAYYNVTSGRIAPDVTATQATNAGNPASLNATTASAERLRVRGIAGETNSTTAITVTSTWTKFVDTSGLANTTGAAAATNQAVRGEFLISTATGAASLPTWAVSADLASCYVAFREAAVSNQAVTATGAATATVAGRVGKSIAPATGSGAAVSLRAALLRTISAASVGVASVTKFVNTPPRTGFGALTRMGPSGYGIRQGFAAPTTPSYDSPDDIAGLLLWLDAKDAATITSASSPFLPTSVAGCLLWLDAADAATITASGGLVSAWANKGSVGGSFVQATSGNQFSQTTNAHGNAVGCTSSGKFMSGGTNAAYDIANMTVLSVVKPAASGGNMEILTRFNDTSFSGWYYEVNWSSGTNGASAKITQWDASFNNSNAGASVTLSSLRAWVGTSYRRSSGVMAATVNGSSNNGVSHTYVPPISSTYNILIGARDGGGPVNFIGDIHEVLMFDSGLSDADRQMLEGYLAWKWGLQADLVSGHPYASAPPAGGGTLVSSWANKGSVGGTLGQSVAANKPALTSNANGPCLRFGEISTAPANGSYLIGSTTSAYDITTRTVFTVHKPRAPASGTGPGGGSLLTRFDDATSYGFMYAIYKASTKQYVDASEMDSSFNFVAADTGQTRDFTATVVYSDRLHPTTSYLPRMTGDATGSTFVPGAYAAPVGTMPIMLGGHKNMSTSAVTLDLNADVHEVLLYNGILSLSDYEIVEGYLAWKWGLQADLPSSHPYYGAPPWPLGGTTTPLTITAAAASTALVAARNAYLRTISAAAASAVTIGRVVARLLAITVSSASAFTMLRITAHPRAITASGGSTVTLGALKVLLKAITASGGAVVTIVRSVLKPISVAGASAVSITRSMVKAITVAGASAVSVSKQMAKAITAAAASVVTIIAARIGLSRLISVTGGATVTLARVPQKVVSVVGASAVSLARVFAPIRIISVVGAAGVSIARTTAGVRGVTVATASAVTVSAIRAFLRPISAAGASIVTIGRSTLKGVTAASTSAVSITRQMVKTISVAGASAIVIGRGVFKSITVATGATATVGALRAFLKGVTASGASTVLLARQAGKAVAVASASAITIGRRLAAGLTIAVQGSALVSIAKRMSRTITAATASAVALVPFHGLVRLISVATASVAVVGRGNFRTLLISGASAASIATKRITGIFAARPSLVTIGRGGTKLISVATASIASLFTLGLTIGRHALERMINLLPISRTVTLEAKDRRINLLPEPTDAKAKDEYP
jgi:hypothetical protein